MTYDVDFNLQILRLLPTMLRKTRLVALLTAFIKPIDYIHKLTILYFKGATTESFYDASYVIVPGQRVRRHGKLYENVSGVNQTGVDPLSSPTIYREVVKDWRGAQRRIRYNSQKTILEFVLNEWFDLIFRQPDYTQNPLVYHSDIYIILNEPKRNYFVVKESIEGSSAVYDNDKGEDAVFELIDLTNGWDIKVMYPAAEMTAGDNKYKEMVALVDQYLVYGTTAIYESY